MRTSGTQEYAFWIRQLLSDLGPCSLHDEDHSVSEEPAGATLTYTTQRSEHSASEDALEIPAREKCKIH